MATPGLSVWVVDDDESVRWVLEQALKQAHMFPRAFETGEEFFGALKLGRPDVLITDIRMPDMSGLELMERLARTDPDIPVIVITAHSDLDSAVSAYQGGAFEYLPKPFDIDEAIELVSRAARQRTRGAAEQTAVEADAAHHRPGAGDAGGLQGDRSLVALEHDGADHGRVGHRQGARGARAARQLAARRPARSSR